MPFSYEKLLRQFGERASRSARFRRVAIHVHSPESRDFGLVDCDPALNERSQYLDDEAGAERFISYLSESHDLVAITDHMKFGYSCKLSKMTSTRRGLCILPGVELNLRLKPPLDQVRVHMLAIFPESASVGEIEKIFPIGMPLDSDRSGQEEITEVDLAKFAETIKAHGGLVIAAHIDNDKGIRMLFRQTGKQTIALFNPENKVDIEEEKKLSESFKNYLLEVNLDGIEIRSDKDRIHYSWEVVPGTGERHSVPAFLTFDAHSIERIQRPDKMTFVKMTEVSWNGLAEAIRFPETRIRFSEGIDPAPQIIGIEISSAHDGGFFRELQIGFAENLNCIIGPRGSGKSTIIDAIRYVMGYNRTLNQLDSPDLSRGITDRQAKTLQNSVIRLAYRLISGDVHILEATYDQQSDYVTKVYDHNGEALHVPDVEQTGDYPVRLFGWSEIETLGRELPRQRDLLDKLVPELAIKLATKKDLKSRLAQNREEIKREILTLTKYFQAEERRIRRYEEFRKRFDALNTEKVKVLFRDLDLERRKKGFLQKVLDLFDEFSKNVQIVDNQVVESAIREGLEKDSGLKTWWDELRKDKLDALFSQMKNSAEELATKTGLSIEAVKHVLEAARRNIEKLEKDLRDVVASDEEAKVHTDLRDQAKGRLEDVETIRSNYLGSLNQLKSLLKARNSDLLPATMECHSAISELRQVRLKEIQNRLNEFKTSQMVISIEIEPDGDRSEFCKALAGSDRLSLAARQFKSKKWPEILSSFYNPVSFCDVLMSGDATSLILEATIEGLRKEITAEEANKIVEEFRVFGYDDLADVETVNTEILNHLVELQEVEWDDKETILTNGKPVNEVSPGQRSSAMLPLIALSETVPLIIDQPEDNLDNRLVGKVLVDILSKLKERRQIIVSTHNPNIVVLGDAEQTIVLDAVSDVEGKIEDQASIDDPFIVKMVIELMEGGKTAFETRSKRYGVTG